MSAFTNTNIPAGVNTLEKAVAWTCGAFYQLNKNTKYQESENSILVPIITEQDGLAADKTERIIFRVSLPMNADWRSSTNKYWLDVLEVSNTAIPSVFTS